MKILKQIMIVMSMCFAISVSAMDEKTLEKAICERKSLIEGFLQDLEDLGDVARQSSMYNAIEARLEKRMLEQGRALNEMAAVVLRNIEKKKE